MASQSLYRKWRSQTFSDLIGQDAVSQTLLNAVREGRLAHAYLFCGPRGTGKTSTARLLAKAVNCANPVNGEPCNECLSCREITAGRSPDVIEIDAASNTGVDNIRDLRENVNLMGTGGHFKLYIVDECFSYGELVTLADGSKMPIGKLVESQWQGEVLSYNPETGMTEPKPIVRHMRKQSVLPAVRVTFDNNRSVVCTINHKFYTPQGQVCAGHLQPGQFVYTNRERITRHQRAVLIGAAIGDGHIALTGSIMRGRLSLRHRIDQKDYLEYKVQLLGDLVRSPMRFEDGAGTYSKTGTYCAATLSRPEIAQIHRDLYRIDGRKQITQTYLDQVDELGLALWYLDDGSLVTAKSTYERRTDGGISTYLNPRSFLSMYGFTPEEAQMVCDWHQERWGIESRVTKTARGPVIWLTLAGTRRLHQIIAPYVPPIMEYKLFPQYRGQFQCPVDDGVLSGLAVSVVKSIEQVPAPEYVYNIEVADNHNYFVRDILVANCHMLTTSAFNALLKTLEEPPPHIIFVLATTEAHKVLPTVVSRCQRFDFRRFGMRDLVQRLYHVAEGEGLEIEPAAAELLARAAQGGMRDALSLLDQAMAFCGTQIDLERTRAMLGLADPAAIRNLIVFVADGDAAGGLHLINEMVATGADLRQLNSQLAEEWRALVLARAGANVAELMDRTDDDARAITELAQRFSLEELTGCARVFARNETPARGLPVPQLALELSFLDCLHIRTHGAQSMATQPAVTTARPAVPQAPATQPARPAMPAPAPTTSVPPARPTARKVEELDLDAIERDDAPPAPDIWGEPADGNTSEQAAPVAAEIDILATLPDEDDHQVAPFAGAPTDEPLTSFAQDDEAGANDNASDSFMETLFRAQNQWDLVKQVCKQKSRSVAALLHSAQPILLEQGELPVLVIQAAYQFHLEKLREPASRTAVEWALEQVLEQPVRIKLTLGNSGNGGNGNGNGHGPGGNGSGGGNGGNRRGSSSSPSVPNLANGAGGGPSNAARPVASMANAVPAGDNVRPFTAPAGRAPASPVRTAVRDESATYGTRTDEAYEADVIISNITPIRRNTQSQSSAAAPVGRPSADAQPPRPSINQTQLEAQVRADPVVQSLLRVQGIELADVRPLDEDEL
jgi:DNA polymerase III gamma/tau subunit